MYKITMTSKEFGLLIESRNVADLLLMAADAFEGLGGKVFGAPRSFGQKMAGSVHFQQPQRYSMGMVQTNTGGGLKIRSQVDRSRDFDGSAPERIDEILR